MPADGRAARSTVPRHRSLYVRRCHCAPPISSPPLCGVRWCCPRGSFPWGHRGIRSDESAAPAVATGRRLPCTAGPQGSLQHSTRRGRRAWLPQTTAGQLLNCHGITRSWPDHRHGTGHRQRHEKSHRCPLSTAGIRWSVPQRPPDLHRIRLIMSLGGDRQGRLSARSRPDQEPRQVPLHAVAPRPGRARARRALHAPLCRRGQHHAAADRIDGLVSGHGSTRPECG